MKPKRINMEKQSIIAVAAIIITCALLSGAAGQGCEEVVELESDETQQQGIIGGTETGYNSWKGVIAVELGGGHCTGALIDPDIVLTAGHCFAQANSATILGGASLSSPIQYTSAASIVKHPQWNNGNLSVDTTVDLTMLKLASPITQVEYYCVRDEPKLAPPVPAKIVGYGWLTPDGGGDGVARMGDSTILRLDPGGAGTPGMGGEDVFEFGNPTGGCHGDSGGPVFSEQGGKWVVTGVESYGITSPVGGYTGQCETTKGGFAVNVLTYRAWVESVAAQMNGTGLPADCVSASDDDDDVAGDDDDDDDNDNNNDNNDNNDDNDDDNDTDTEKHLECGCRTVGQPYRSSLFSLISRL